MLRMAVRCLGTARAAVQRELHRPVAAAFAPVSPCCRLAASKARRLHTSVVLFASKKGLEDMFSAESFIEEEEGEEYVSRTELKRRCALQLFVICTTLFIYIIFVHRL